MATSKKHDVPRKILRNRFLGKTVSRQEAMSEYHQCLTAAEEEALIKLINYLINCGLSPIKSIVKNLTEEIIGH